MFDNFIGNNFIGNNSMGNNLGISYIENTDYDMNTHIEQGVEFKKKNNNVNEHPLLESSFSSERGSIIQAFNSEDSINLQETFTSTAMSDEQTNFHNMVSQYARDYNDYTQTLLNSPSSDSDRMAIERSLRDQRDTIIAYANQIKNNLGNLENTYADITDAITHNQENISTKLADLTEYNSINADIQNKYDTNTLTGKIETASLNMTSMYYHYLVYFILTLTLITFTFNIIVNPDANPMSAVFVLVALVVVYLTARYYSI
jgi:hypothetical protein